jgi:hypothetical protein
MKATWRVDGQYRFTIRMEYHLGFEDICSVFANRIHFGDWPILPSSRSDVEHAFRFYIRRRGDPTTIDHCGILDNVPENLIGARS